jgi:hypothetical protein
MVAAVLHDVLDDANVDPATIEVSLSKSCCRSIQSGVAGVFNTAIM